MNSVTIVWDDAIALRIDGLELDQWVPTAGISCDMHRNSTASIGARRRGTDEPFGQLNIDCHFHAEQRLEILGFSWVSHFNLTAKSSPSKTPRNCM